MCPNELPDPRRKRCGSCNTKIRRIRNKARAIEYLGGACTVCGYDKHPSALQFHHRDPTTKSFTIGNVANRAWKIIEAELDKCDLICANCHAILHSDRTEAHWLAEAANYQGHILEL
jgi:predicted HNH restriction endonuclease